jgi:septum formation protein
LSWSEYEVKTVNFDTTWLFDYRLSSMQLILASQSPYRKAMLEAFGISFQTMAPKVSEESLKVSGPKDLAELTRYLALKKAESLKAAFDNAVIVGCDQIAEVGGERLDKPGDTPQAVAQLKKLQGKTHRLITSLAVVSPLKTIQHTDVTTLTMRTLTDEEIHEYIRLDLPFDCAGSYKIEKAGLALMVDVTTHDPSAIQGLPLIALSKALLELGLSPSQMWSRK